MIVDSPTFQALALRQREKEKKLYFFHTTFIKHVIGRGSISKVEGGGGAPTNTLELPGNCFKGAVSRYF